jgi:uncharacterized repeat protein (TIGR03803 family)
MAFDLALRQAWVLPVLIAGLHFLPAGHLIAQTFTTLHSFTATTNSGPPYPTLTNSDGANPFGGLITNASSTTLYGTTKYGGSWGDGVVFAVNTDGTGFTNLYSFTANMGPGYTDYTNSDGAYPQSGLVLSGNTLYGTARAGGTHKAGTVFALNTDGSGFTNLHTFIGTDGASPDDGLILSGNTLYGTTTSGGSSGNATVFAVNTDGSGFTNLHSFTAMVSGTNSDGAEPEAGLILSGNTLYGTTLFGGSWGNGTVFALNTDGTGFTTLRTFSATPPYPAPFTNSDGRGPFAGLILSGSTLYGTTASGGRSGNGTVFALNADGTGFTTLYSFTAPDQTYQTNSDGASPEAGLLVSGNTLYGTATHGGTSGRGTVFALNTDGTDFTTLHSFAVGVGAGPYAGLILSGSTLYGTTVNGGIAGGRGTVFSLSFRPQLTITPAGPNVVLSWPTNVAGFDYTGYTLKSTTNLASPVLWVTNLPAPVVVNGQVTVTNPIAGAQQFYRLIQ